jgi:D-glycero-D-manno-heptose 1,7-bisphosphate phosphatase
MRRAALGLALRGHRIDWWGTPPSADELRDGAPAGLRIVSGVRDLWGTATDVVLADRPHPFAAARAGWFTRADCLVLPLVHETVVRWGPLDRWAWSSLHAHGLIAAAEGPAFQERPGELDLERIALWPQDAPDGDAADAGSDDTEILERACERALARHRARAPRAAVVVDRDGTLVKEIGYLSDPADLELLPGAARAIREAHAAGLPVIVVSNQSGVGRGLFPLSRVYAAMARLRALLREEGAEPDAIYFCPHRPEADCPCRKPRPGLLVRAADDLVIDLTGSVMIGDKRLDAATGHAAGGFGVLVRTGYGREEEEATGAGLAPDAVCDDVAAAVRWFLDREAISA